MSKIYPVCPKYAPYIQDMSQFVRNVFSMPKLFKMPTVCPKKVPYVQACLQFIQSTFSILLYVWSWPYTHYAQSLFKVLYDHSRSNVSRVCPVFLLCLKSDKDVWSMSSISCKICKRLNVLYIILINNLVLTESGWGSMVKHSLIIINNYQLYLWPAILNDDPGFIQNNLVSL